MQPEARKTFAVRVAGIKQHSLPHAPAIYMDLNACGKEQLINLCVALGRLKLFALC